MSAFDDLYLEAAVPVLIDQHGQTVTYVDRDDVETSITAIVGQSEDEEQADLDGRRFLRRRSVTVQLSEITPAIDGRIKIAGVHWAIERIEDYGANLVRLNCVLRSRIESSQPTYRRGGI